MKPVHWLFLLSILLSVFGLVVLVVGVSTLRDRPAQPSAPSDLQPVASVKQIMIAIVDPAANVVFNSVSTTVTNGKTEEKMPRTDAEWEAVAASGAALIESGNLMLVGQRLVDRNDWVAQNRKLMEAGTAAIKATEARDAERLFEAGGTLYESCDGCHRLYKRTS